MPRNQDNSEKRIMREIMEAIGSMDGVCVHRNNCGTAMFNGARVEYGVGGKGAPDLVCEVKHCGGFWRVLWMEVKTPDGVIEPHQTKWHAVARSQGRPVVIVRCIDDAAEAIERVRKGHATHYDRSNDQARCEGE